MCLDLCRLEAEVRRNVLNRNLLYIAAELQHYYSIFEVVNACLNRILDDNLHGCQLLSVFCDYLNNYIPPAIEAAVAKIRCSCLNVFSNQLLEWLNFGKLDDKFSEFFLCSDASNPYDVIVRQKYKPAFIPDFMSHKIRFIGQNMRLIRMGNDNSCDHNFELIASKHCCELRSILLDPQFDATRLNQPIQQLQRHLSEKLWQLVSNRSLISKKRDSLFDCLENIRNYFLLSKGELFLALIDQLGDYSGKNDIKFEQNFSGSSTGSVKSHKSYKTDGLNRLLYNCLLKWQENCTNLDELSCRSDGSGAVKMQFNPDLVDNMLSSEVWQAVEVRLEVNPRLRHIFDPLLLEQCSKIFAFLFKIRYVHANLNKCWSMLLKTRKGSSERAGSPTRNVSHVLLLKMWRVVNLMLFFVNNLQFYLHVDILDSLYRHLIVSLTSETHDYEKAKMLVQEFIKNVSTSCFMETKEIAKIVDGLLDSCQAFAECATNELAVNGQQPPSPDAGNLAKKVHDGFVAYERRASLLFKILSNPKMHVVNPHLAQLLQRLDMNSYFSSTCLF